MVTGLAVFWLYSSTKLKIIQKKFLNWQDPTCLRMASRSRSRTNSSLSWTLVSRVLRGSEKSWKKLSSGSKWLSVWTSSMYLLTERQTMRSCANRQAWPRWTEAIQDVRVDQLVTDLAGEEDVGTQTEPAPGSLVTHGLPQVPQAEDRRQRHEAVRVVSCFGCHVSPAPLVLIKDGLYGLCRGHEEESTLYERISTTTWAKRATLMSSFSYKNWE